MKMPTRINDRYRPLNDYVASIQDVIAVSGAASVVIQNDCVINEWYRGYHDTQSVGSRRISPDSQFNVGSVRKSYLGFAVSFAVSEGKIASIDDPISRCIGGLDQDLFRDITVRHLLTHTDGVRYTERLFPTGTNWAYNNCGVNLLIQLITQLYNCSLEQFMEERVFRHCGFQETGWRRDRTEALVWQDESYIGLTGTEANLFVSARELAYWGYLHLVGGKYQGIEIACPEVFQRAVTVQSPRTLRPLQPRNGFLWVVQDVPSPVVEIGESVPEGSFQILGITGCACLVIPRHNVVAVRMYNQKGSNPVEYDYLKDIKTWGNLVLECASA